MSLAHETLSECALKIYEVSLKYLLRLSGNRVDTILRMDRQMDGWMDGQKEAREKQYVSGPFQGGII